jgi:hypothetical protein
MSIEQVCSRGNHLHGSLYPDECSVRSEWLLLAVLVAVASVRGKPC